MFNSFLTYAEAKTLWLHIRHAASNGGHYLLLKLQKASTKIKKNNDKQKINKTNL